MASNIYLIEDQDLMRSSMKAFLEGESDLSVVGTAESAEEALSDFESFDDSTMPDLVLIDVALPGMSGIELLETLLARYSDLACLMLSGHAEESYVKAARGAGAQGYVMKGRPNEYLEATRTILDGKTYRSDTVGTMWDENGAST